MVISDMPVYLPEENGEHYPCLYESMQRVKGGVARFPDEYTSIYIPGDVEFTDACPRDIRHEFSRSL